MERLTEKIGNTNCVKGCGSNCKYGFQHCSNEDWENCQTIDDVVDKLADYEDLEEQGRLIKLPCKVGDTVWDNDFGRPCAYTITSFSFGECEEYICKPVTTKEVVFYYEDSSGSITGSFAESAIGKSVFLNKSEAEAKLKELRGAE